VAEPDTWLIGVTVGSGVVFKGNREDAQKHMDAYMEHLRGMFVEKGLAFVRKDYTIRLKGDPVVDESEDVDTTQSGNGVVAA
jgi:hypothetical protein